MFSKAKQLFIFQEKRKKEKKKERKKLRATKQNGWLLKQKWIKLIWLLALKMVTDPVAIIKTSPRLEIITEASIVIIIYQLKENKRRCLSS